jgi:UBX domain
MNLALGSNTVQTPPTQADPPAANPTPAAQTPASPQPPRSEPSQPSQPSASSSTSQQSRAPAPANPPIESRADEAAEEKKARLEAQKKALKTKDEARRAAEIRARRDEIDVIASKSTADKKYAMMQKKRAQDARDERTRILKRVEDDKAERRERDAQRKAEAKALADGQPLPSGPSSLQQAKSTNSAECALQIRMFDGSTIRNRFSSSASLRRDVRPWVDEKQTGDQPYNFKQVLTPLPNKNIETSEEEGTLQSLGLTPSATLILVPIAAYSSAYEGGTGLVSRGISAGYGVVSSGLGMVTGLLGGFLGGSAAPAAEELRQAPTSASNPNPNPSINVRTLRDQQPSRDDQQFYNGNAVSSDSYFMGAWLIIQLNFEPRRDENDKKED